MKSGSEIRRIGKFGIVGILNTLIDFTIYNLASTALGLSLVASNLISTTVAMIFSFFANKHLVFQKSSRAWHHQVILFYVVTAFGLYVLQTGTILLLTSVWTAPLHTLVDLCHAVGVQDHDAFIIKNGAKVAGSVLSLAWNYIMYKRVVFK